MPRSIPGFVAVAVVLAAAACADQAPGQVDTELFQYDRSLPLDVQVLSSTAGPGYTISNITYASPLGGTVPAYLFVPDGAGPFPGMLFMHGLPGSREGMTVSAADYAARGVVAIAISAPFARPTVRANPVTFTPQDSAEQVQLIVDMQRAVDLLVARSDVDPTRLGYLGISYGGAMGGLLAGVERRIKAYALVVGDGGLVAHFTGADDADGPLSGITPGQRDAWLAAMEPIEPIRFVGNAAPAALLFQQGRTDQLVPAADAEVYSAAGSEPKQILWYDAGHGLNEIAVSDRRDWFRSQLGF